MTTRTLPLPVPDSAGQSSSAVNPALADYDYSHFYYSSSDDVFAIFPAYDEWWYGHARPSGYYLFYQPMSTPPAPRVDVGEGLGGRRLKLLNLASYNYLGLSYHPEVLAAARAALEQYGLGAAGSPTLSGTMDVHAELERALARFTRKEAVTVFPTGYSANVGVVSALMRPGDLIVADQNVHASIVDGAILSKANVRFFRHNRPDDLERKLRGTSGKRLVIVEGVYSMDGDLAPLADIVTVTRKYGARLMLDEAHSGFVYGPTGRGVAEQFGVESEIDIRIGTFSKALGGMGGFVAGSQSLYNYMMGFARSRVFSCALSPVIGAGVLQALRIVERDETLRQRLWTNTSHMRRLLADAGVDVGESTSQIIPVMVRKDKQIFAIAERLQRDGLYLQPIIYPAVAKHRSRFRVTISATHTPAMLEEAATILIGALRAEGVL